MSEQEIVDDLVSKWVSLGREYSRGVEDVSGIYAYGASEEGEKYANIFFEQDGVVDYPGRLKGIASDPTRVSRMQQLMRDDMRDAEAAYLAVGVAPPIEYRVHYQTRTRRLEVQLLRESKFAHPSEKDMTEGIQDWLGDRAPKLFGRGAPRG